MLAIRMQRNGRAHLPMYRIVVQEAQRHPLSGRVVAEVGNYNPATKKVVLDTEKVEFYLKNGAKPSSRVAFVFKKNGVKLPDWYKEAPAKSAKGKHQDKLRKNQPKEEPVEEAPVEAAEAPAEEAPAEAPVEEAPAAEEAPAEEAPAETPAE